MLRHRDKYPGSSSKKGIHFGLRLSGKRISRENRNEYFISQKLKTTSAGIYPEVVFRKSLQIVREDTTERFYVKVLCFPSKIFRRSLEAAHLLHEVG